MKGLYKSAVLLVLLAMLAPTAFAVSACMSSRKDMDCCPMEESRTTESTQPPPSSGNCCEIRSIPSQDAQVAPAIAKKLSVSAAPDTCHITPVAQTRENRDLPASVPLSRSQSRLCTFLI